MLAISLWAANPTGPLVMVPDPQAVLRPETADQTTDRHAKVARARDGTVILLHLGAWDYPISPLLYRVYQQAMPITLQWMRRLAGR